MDKNKGSLIIKFSGKDSLDLNVLTKLCNCLLNVLNKISLMANNSKSEYSVSYSSGDGFSLIINQDSQESHSIIDNNINVFNIFIDLLLMRRFILKTGKFDYNIENDLCNINNTIDTETYSLTSYSIYSSDNLIEDSLSKLSSIILSKKNSFQAIYKNGILDKRVTYSKEDLDSTSTKINLETMNYSKEEYNLVMSLQVEQLDLSASSSWKFKDITNAKGGTFKAKIKDKDFSKKLKSGNVVIGYGLILKSDVKTTIVKDKSGKVIPSKSSYVIEKVYDVLYGEHVDSSSLSI